jgi:hypothetical protein
MTYRPNRHREIMLAEARRRFNETAWTREPRLSPVDLLALIGSLLLLAGLTVIAVGFPWIGWAGIAAGLMFVAAAIRVEHRRNW